MNRIDRLFNILLLLQTRRLIRAQDIAARFDISERTVYRDIAALHEMGVPIVAQAGEGYSLMEGYFLPPLVLTVEEAGAAFLAVNMLTASSNLPTGADNLLTKLTAALPRRTRERGQRQAEIVRFAIRRGDYDLNNPRLLLLQQAIEEKRVLRLRYFSYTEQQLTERDIEPLHLTWSDGTWYFDAYCRLRQDFRAFRLDRVETLALLDQTFVARDAQPSVSLTKITVEIRVAARFARWLRERQHYGFVSEHPDPADPDAIRMVYQVHQLHELQNWLPGWGTHIEVLTPPEFRAWLYEQAKTLAIRYADSQKNPETLLT